MFPSDKLFRNYASFLYLYFPSVDIKIVIKSEIHIKQLFATCFSIIKIYWKWRHKASCGFCFHMITRILQKKCFYISIRIMLYTLSVFLGFEIKDILYAVHLFTGVYIMQNTLVLGGGENTASITILNIGLKSPRRYQPLRQYTLLCPFTTMCTHIAL